MDKEQGGRLQEELLAWRREHPHATLTDIEAALDRQLYTWRARLLEDLAMTSSSRGADGDAAPEQPRCPVCGGMAAREGQRERHLTTRGDKTITLRRDYVTCGTCGAGFFPPG